MINSHEVILSCPHYTFCSYYLYVGSCKQECLNKRAKELGNAVAKWKHRAANNDFLWCECSNCGFRVENYVAVVCGKSSTDYVDVKYKFCPMCGKPMGV